MSKMEFWESNNFPEMNQLPYELQNIPDYKGFESKKPNLESQQFKLSTSLENFNFLKTICCYLDFKMRKVLGPPC